MNRMAGIGNYVIAILSGVFIVALIITAMSAKKQSDAASYEKMARKAQIEGEMYARRSPELIQEQLESSYLRLIQAAHPNWNYIIAKTSKRKGGKWLLAKHAFFNRYEFHAGPLAAAVSKWIDVNKADLDKIGIKRVGVSSGDDWVTLQVR